MCCASLEKTMLLLLSASLAYRRQIHSQIPSPAVTPAAYTKSRES